MKAAFLAGPELKGGRLHINVYALFGLCYLAFELQSPLILAAGLCLELLYLGVMTGSKRFRTPLEHQHRLARYVEFRDRQLAKLDRDNKARFERLDVSCRELIELSGKRAGVGSRFGLLLELAEVFLGLLVLHLELGRQDNETKIAEELSALEAELHGAEGVQKESLAAAVNLLKRRLTLTKEARDRRSLVDAELHRIEQQVALLSTESALNKAPALLREKVDAIVWTLEESRQLLDERSYEEGWLASKGG